MAKTKTGIFSGSFNPIHIGHLALANYLCEFEGLDEVWFMVTPHNPFKNQADLWPDELRLQLVQLAIEGYPRFRVSDFEFHLPRPSYTIHTTMIWSMPVVRLVTKALCLSIRSFNSRMSIDSAINTNYFIV